MELDFNWLHLPDFIWESILCNLRVGDLLKASETCKQFNDLLSGSQRLMSKIRFKFENPDSKNHTNEVNKRNWQSMEPLCEMKVMKECLLKSERKYDSIFVSAVGYSNYIFDILKHFAGSVKEITFHKTTLQAHVFIKIIQVMKNLKVLKLMDDFKISYSKAGREIERPEIVSSIDEIYINKIGRQFLFDNLYMFDTITTLDVNEGDCESLEIFLLMQKNLKVLHLKDLNEFMFETDIPTKDIKFSLDELTLQSVSWINNQNALKFFKSQNNFKKIALNLYSENQELDDSIQVMWNNELLIHLLVNNLQLKTVVVIIDDSGIYEYTIDFTNLKGIVNPRIENFELYFNSPNDATELISKFTKIFPNVKNFTFKVRSYEDKDGLDQINSWKSLETIKCVLEDINHFFQSVHLGEQLTTCTIEFSEDYDIDENEMTEFLDWQNIKHMTLVKECWSYNPISDEIRSLIENALECHETLKCEVKKLSFRTRFYSK